MTSLSDWTEWNGRSYYRLRREFLERRLADAPRRRSRSESPDDCLNRAEDRYRPDEEYEELLDYERRTGGDR